MGLHEPGASTPGSSPFPEGRARGGGGSGCEPTHTGFVGYGMLDAAAPGQIFTSPVPNQIVAATRRANAGSGVLHIIKNFTGEVMNFGMAQEILYFEDIQVAQVVVNDDVSIPDDGKRLDAGGSGPQSLSKRLQALPRRRAGNCPRCWPLPRK